MMVRSNEPIACGYCVPSTVSDAVIGFERTQYAVEENDGQVVVKVLVLEGALTGNVLVRFNTSSGSAQRK